MKLWKLNKFYPYLAQKLVMTNLIKNPSRLLAKNLPFLFRNVLCRSVHLYTRARICKCQRSTGIDSKESILPVYVAWRAGTSNRVVVPTRRAGNRFRSSLKGFQIRARCTTAPRYSIKEDCKLLIFTKPTHFYPRFL